MSRWSTRTRAACGAGGRAAGRLVAAALAGGRSRAAAGILGVSMAIWAAAPGLSAQESSGEAPEDPPMPEAPEQFRLGLTLGGFDWTEEPGRNAVEDLTMLGAEVETLVHAFLSLRFGVSYGRPEIRSGLDRASADQYMVELLVNVRLSVDPLRRLGLVPFLSGGYGSVVHAPEDRDDLITKNQSAYLVGAGLEYDGLPRAGVRAEWRRARVELNDLFEPESRDATMREVGRWVLGVYWRF